MSTLVYLSLGANVGDCARNIREAITRLGALGRVVAASSFYETEPVEFIDQDWFLNCAVALETKESPTQLMAALLQIEQQMIDLLLENDSLQQRLDNRQRPSLSDLPEPRVPEKFFIN